MDALEALDEFEIWIERMIKDAREKLLLTDEMLAHLLMEHALDHYVRSLAKKILR